MMRIAEAVLGWLFGPGRQTRRRLSRDGLWVNSADLEEAAPAALPAVYVPRYLRRAEPGAPLPAGVDPDAPRYDPVVCTELPRRFRGPVALVGVVVALGSIGAIVGGIPWGFVTLAAGPALIGVGITGGTEGVTFRRSPTGAWIEADGVAPAIEPSPRFGPWTRGFAALGAAIAAWLAVTGIGAGPWDEVLIAGAVGALLAGVAVWDALPIPRPDLEREILADRRFYELADPTRPLTDEDLGI